MARCMSGWLMIVKLRILAYFEACRDHTTVSMVGVDAVVRIDDDDTLTKPVGHHSHLATAATHSIRSKAVSADHCAACMVEAAAALNARSDASCGCGSLVWIYTTTPRIQIASKAARLSCVAAHVTHVEKRERTSCTWQCWQAERGGQRSAVLVPG